ncbi:hypothetical protein D9O50_17605 [Oxalobacteraceae bacterium CAVE-383]|nr:hypothetical protein D9O50_17605 [Oxalobacteraceae bacterium CAVE-383]
MKKVIFQIGNGTGEMPAADGGFDRLERVADAPAGWGDYPTIRAYFLGNEIDEETLYGFFPSGFTKQTGLGAAEIAAFISANPGRDGYTFFPFIQDAACFLNVFEQGELQAPGLLATAQAFLDSIGLPVVLADVVTDFSETVHSGYMVAKPVFWRTWFDLAEQIFGLDAKPAMKQAIVDRLASLVLALDGALAIAPFDITAMPCSDSAYLRYWDGMERLNAEKQSFRLDGSRDHLNAFFRLRNKILLACEPRFEASAMNKPVSEASMPVSGDLVYGCITHVPLPVAFPDFVLPFYLGDSQGPERLNLRDWAPEWEPYHPIVAGQLGNFALKNYILKHHPDVKRIGVCLYRKFISRERISGVPAEDNWMMDVVSDSDFEKQDLAGMMAPGEQDFLIGQTCGFTLNGESAGYLLHYSHAHHAEDLLRFTAEAVELGVLQASEVDAFFNEKVFLMGGIEIGVFPAAFWLAAVAAIESTIWACVQRYPVQREGYQTRAWAFCAERLGSYLLLKYLRQQYGDPGYEKFFGQLNLITKGDATLYVPSN